MTHKSHYVSIYVFSYPYFVLCTCILLLKGNRDTNHVVNPPDGNGYFSGSRIVTAGILAIGRHWRYVESYDRKQDKYEKRKSFSKGT